MPTKNPPAEASETSRRRSQRVALSVPIDVTSASRNDADSGAAPPFQEETSTLVVNAHGALVRLEAKVEKGETLVLKNRYTHGEHACRVSYVGPESEGKKQVGVEFTSSAPEFWGIVFPMDAWHSTAAAAQKEAKEP